MTKTAIANPKVLAERLRWCRKVKGKTLRDVESATGISNAYLSQLETGKIKDPGLYRMKTLTQYYGITLEDLLNLRKDSP